MTTILKATDKGQLLTAITTLLGYTPTQSLVITPFRGSRAEGAMRIDLPTPGSAEEATAVATQSIGLICRLEGVTGIAAAIYTDTATDHEPLAGDLYSVCNMLGLDVAAVFYSTPTTWGEYFTGQAHSEPAPAVDAAPALAEGDQHAGATLPDADPALAAALAAASVPTDDDASLNAFFEEILTTDLTTPDPATLAHLAAIMVVPALRDAALLQWASNAQTGREAITAQLAWSTAETPIPDHLAAIYLGASERPAADRLTAALAACRITAAHVTGDEHAALLAAAAWLSWAQGRTTHAQHYLNHAADADPELTITGVLDVLLATGTLPAWSFTR